MVTGHSSDIRTVGKAWRNAGCVLLCLLSVARTLEAAPANDNFANRIGLNGTDLQVAASNVGATIEAGEPAAHRVSVWWSWTSPVNGYAAIWRQGPYKDIWVYTGTALGALSAVPNTSGATPSYVFAVTQGTVYQIAAGRQSCGSGDTNCETPFTLSLLATPAATNGNFANRILLSGANAVVRTLSAGVSTSSEAGEPVHCDDYTRSLWWSWTAPFSGTAFLERYQDGPSIPCMDVYSGNLLSSLVAVPNLDEPRSPQYHVWSAVAGTTYQLAVSHEYYFQDVMAFRLRLLPTPANDQFSNRPMLNGVGVSVTGNNAGATKEPGEPNHAEQPALNSVWWSWTAPSTGPVMISTEGSDFDTTLSVYTGSSVSALQWVNSDNDSGAGSASQAFINAVQGQRYEIAVAGFKPNYNFFPPQAEAGNIRLSISGVAVTNFGPNSPAALPNVRLSKEGFAKTFATQSDGKVIVGGIFSAVSGEPRQNLARLNQNGTLDMTWGPSVDGEINLLLIHNNDLFLSGLFQRVNGVRRAGLAKVSLVDGSVDPLWDPNPIGPDPNSFAPYVGLPRGPMKSLVAIGNSLFVAGNFTSIGGLQRSNLVKLDAAGTGRADPVWNPQPDRTVITMATHAGKLIIGGFFVRLGAIEKESLARISAEGAGTVDTTWNPVLPYSWVMGLVVQGDNLFVGYAWGNGSSELAKISLIDGTNEPFWGNILGFRPSFISLAVVQDALFTINDGEMQPPTLSRFSLSAPNAANPSWTAPVFSKPVYETDPRGAFSWTSFLELYGMGASGGQLMLGGNFSAMNNSPALGLARINPVSGAQDQSFAAHLQRPGAALAIARQSDGKIIIGGEFVMVDDLARWNLARFDPDGTLDASWSPRVNGAVKCFASTPAELYLGGLFERGLARINLAQGGSIDASWPQPSVWFDSVETLLLVNNKLFLLEDGLTIVDPLTGTVERSGIPELGYANLRSMAVQGDGKIILGGDLYTTNGMEFRDLIRIGSVAPYAIDSAWTPAFNPILGEGPTAIAVYDTNLFVATGGNILQFRLTGTGAQNTSWLAPDVFSTVGDQSLGIRHMLTVDSNLFVAGLFWPVGSPLQPHDGGGKTMLVKIDAQNGAVKGIWNAGPESVTQGFPTPVHALLPVGDNLYVAGQFGQFAGYPRSGLALLADPDAPTLLEESDGRITLLRNPEDGSEITHFCVTGVTGGTLFKSDGVSPIQPGDFITVADGAAGLQYVTDGGAGSITAVSAVNATPAGAGVASTTLNPQAALVAYFSFDREEYLVSESTNSVRVTVTKRGLGAGSVRVSTSDGSANASDFLVSRDYQPIDGTLSIGSESSITFSVPLHGDSVFEGDEVFYITLSQPGLNSRLGSPIQARVTIIDDDRYGPGGSYLVTMPPAAKPPGNGRLVVTLTPPGVGGWRLAGRWDWQRSGDMITGLANTNYHIEFKPHGNDKPEPQSVYILPSDITYVTRAYESAPADEEAGQLAVVIAPSDLASEPNTTLRAQWRLIQETNWHNSGEAVNAPVGFQEVVLKALPNYLGQLSEPVIWVSAERTRTNFAVYHPAPGAGAVQPQVLSFSDATTTAPFRYNGQIKTRLGLGSGVVVKDKVVLTVAHLLFDDRNLEDVPATEVFWSFRRYAGQYEPVPQNPYGIILMSGYAAQRTIDIRETGVSPGYSTPGSQNRDVAVLCFLDGAGDGGFGGFLASDEPSQFLTSGRRKILAGYPINGIAGPDQGKLHATVATNRVFDLQYAGKSVYSATWLKSFPGNSGGPLYVQYDDGQYYPAAVYLGQSGVGQSLVRAIDNSVVDLINRAEDLAPGGPNHPGGGVTPFVIGVTKQPFGTGLLTIRLGPSAARAGGAGWRILQNPDPAYITDESFTVALTGGSDFEMEFKPVPGFIAPPKLIVRVDVAEVSAISPQYFRWPAELAFSPQGKLTLLGSNRGRYAIQYKDDLSPLVQWQPWTNFTLSNRTIHFNIPGWTNIPHRFYRGVLMP